MTGLRRIGDALGARRGEGPLVGPLLLHSFLSGLSVVFFESIANGVFLSRFSAESLPLAYVGAAVFVPLTGIAYERLQSALPILRVFQATLGFLAAMPLAMGLLVTYVDAPWPAFLLMSMSYVMWALPALEFWGLAARVLDLRQAKRLYPLVGTGEVVGIIVGGAIVGMLLAKLSVLGVLALTSLAAIACLPLPGLLLARVADRPPQEDEAEGPEGARGGFLDTLRMIGRDRYLLILVAFDASYQLTHDALEYTSQVLIQARFAADNEAVSTFVGYLFAAQQVLVLVLRALLSGRLLTRFGLGLGLMTTPAVVVCGGLAVLALGLLTPGGSDAALFWPIIALRMGEVGLLYGIGKPSVLVALRPLAPARRDRGQVLLETAVEPGSTGLTGVNLLALNALLGAAVTTATRALTFLSLVITTAGAWVALGAVVRRAYARVVREELAHGALRDVDLSHDPETIRALEERLLQGEPEGAAAALALVEPRLDDARLAEVLARLLPSGDPPLRDAIYRCLARRPIAALGEVLTERVEQEATPELRAAALRALAATAGPAVARRHLDSSEPAIVEAALGTVLRHDDPRGKGLVEHWAGAPESGHRLRAARVLAAARTSGFAGVVHRLLADADSEVRDAALLAAGACPDANRWDEIAAALGQSVRWRIAAQALASSGDAATKAIVAVLERESTGRTARTRAVRLLAMRPTPVVIAALWRAAADRSTWLRLEAVHALGKASRVVPMPPAIVQSRLDDETRQAVALARSIAELVELPEDSLLRRLLLGELGRACEIVFALLALAYDARTVRRARHQIRSGLSEMRDLAFEVLDTMLSEQNRAALLPILDTLTPDELLAKRMPETHVAPLSHAARLEALANDDRRWVRIFARHAQGRTEEDDMHLVEKIITLKGVEFFASADEDLLAEIASSATEQTFAPDVTIIEEGTMDASMFVLAKGRVQVVPTGAPPMELGAGAVFGELAALDPQPRSASVRTVTDTVLLRVAHSTVVDLMAEHIEIAHGIVRFLIRRYGRHSQGAAR